MATTSLKVVYDAREGGKMDPVWRDCADEMITVVPGLVLSSRMSRPHAGHSSGNSSPTRAISFAQAIREVGFRFGFASQHPSVP